MIRTVGDSISTNTKLPVAMFIDGQVGGRSITKPDIHDDRARDWSNVPVINRVRESVGICKPNRGRINDPACSAHRDAVVSAAGANTDETDWIPVGVRIIGEQSHYGDFRAI